MAMVGSTCAARRRERFKWLQYEYLSRLSMSAERALANLWRDRIV
jgi:hypothetical protein